MKYDGTYDSDFEVRLATLEKLGGDITKHYDSTYEVDLAILDAIQGGGGGGGAVIDDNDVSTGKCWSSAKIVAELSGAGFDVEIVEELPEIGDAHTIYFVPNGGSTGNIYNEWMYIDETWECVGNTAIDLSDYAKISDVDSSLANYATIANVDSSLALKADASDLANYATIANVDASLALKADKTQLSDYATIANVDASLANYATIANVDASLANYATIANVDSSLAIKANASELANYSTITNVDASLSLKADKTELSDYATIANVDASLANYATKNDISTFIDATALTPYATITNVDASLLLKANASDLENYATKNDISTFITANDASIYATITNVDASLLLKQDKLTAGANITIDPDTNVISAVGGSSGASIDDNDVSTNTTWSSNKITTYVDSSFCRKITVSTNTLSYQWPTWNSTGQITGYVTQAYLIPQKVNGKQGYFYGTSFPTLSDIYTPTTAGTQGQYLVSNGSGAPIWQDLDLSGYATITNVDSSLALKADSADLVNYATIANVDASLANYAKTNDISTFITASDLAPYATIANVDSSLDLKANASDLENYATKNDISTFITANDASIYATIANVDSSLALKQDKLTAGQNISIDPDTNVISAVGGSSGASIDDNDVSTNTTWSSNKITIELNKKADSSDLASYATIANVDSSLALKANATDLANYATIANVDSSLALKADASDLANYATIANVDSSLSNYYTKSEASTSFNPYHTVSANWTTLKFPSWNANGQINGYMGEAWQSTHSINGTARIIYSTSAAEMPSIYAPTTAGTAGYYLTSAGSGAPVWHSFDLLKFSSVTQAQYDAMVQAGTIDPQTFYYINDAQ